MRELLSNLSVNVNDKIFIKNPESSELGRKIVTKSIDMIYEHGFEHFTFRKLGIEINSTEASVYRYFENKHKLLLYLSAWYWGWLEYKLVFALANINSATEKLERALILMTEQVKEDHHFSHVNEVKLNYVVISESAKTYLTKKVDNENKEGAFMGYKRLVDRISNIILEVNSDYKYPNMLASSIMEGAHHQRYFSEHLPSLTNSIKGEDSIAEFYKEMVFKVIKIK